MYLLKKFDPSCFSYYSITHEIMFPLIFYLGHVLGFGKSFQPGKVLYSILVYVFLLAYSGGPLFVPVNMAWVFFAYPGRSTWSLSFRSCSGLLKVDCSVSTFRKCPMMFYSRYLNFQFGPENIILVQSQING